MEIVLAVGGKQYWVRQDSIIKTEYVEGKAGDKITFSGPEVVAHLSEKGIICNPKTKVKAEVLEQKRDKKIIVLKKKRRKGYRRKTGFRKEISILKIVSFE